MKDHSAKEKRKLQKWLAAGSQELFTLLDDWLRRAFGYLGVFSDVLNEASSLWLTTSGLV